MRTRPFMQVDVFTSQRYRGNPLAVVMDGEGLSTEEMQRFTNWTHLSEATFLLPPTQAGADYRVRIFSAVRELPFAGHPTLGSCFAWLQSGGKPRGEYVLQECGIGLVQLRREGTRLAFAAPALRRSGPLDEEELARIARGLGVRRRDIVRHAWCDNGPPWRGIMLQSAEQVLGLKPDGGILSGLDVGVVGRLAKVGVFGNACDFEVRAFFQGDQGLAEDPVTGSLNAALAQWLIADGLAPDRYVVSQGTVLGRAGRVYVDRDRGTGTIWVGGECASCVDGTVSL